MLTTVRGQRHLVSRLGICVLVLFAYSWRLQGLARESLWRDEVDALYFAVGDWQQLSAMFAEPGHNGPLYYLGLRPWLQAVGSTEFALRYPSLLLGIIAIPLTWQISRRFLGSSVATCQPAPATVRERWASAWQMLIADAPLLAATFLAVNPYQLWYSQEGKMYTGTTVIALVTVWFWLRAMNQRSGPARWFSLVMVLAIALYVHLLLVLLLPLLALWSLLTFHRNRKGATGLLLISLMVLVLLARQASWLWQFLRAPDPGTGRPFIPLLPLLQATLRSQFSGVLPPAQGGIWLIPMIVLATAGLLYGWRLSPAQSGPSAPRVSAQESHLLIATWIILPLLGIYFLSLFQPLFAPRYLIWIAPALMMALAAGVQLLRPCASRARTLLATWLVIFVVGHGLTTGLEQKQATIKYDLRQAVGYLVQHRDPQELLIFHIPHLEYAYRYYSGNRQANPFVGSDGRLGWTAAGLWTNHNLDDGQSLRQVETEMDQLTRGASEVWVMRSEVESWDARDLMDRWLRQHGRRLESVNFNGVQVVHYTMETRQGSGNKRLLSAHQHLFNAFALRQASTAAGTSSRRGPFAPELPPRRQLTGSQR